MERLTIPDEKVEGGVRRAVIDARKVKEHAMTIYWALKKYEDTGLSPQEILELKERVNDGWIPVDERLPEVGEYVLGTNKYGEVVVYHYGWNSPHSKKMFFHLCGAAATIIAWRPLPEPYCPEGSKQ